MTKIEAKVAHRSKEFTEAQLAILKAKAKDMTALDDDPQEYYYALALLLFCEKEDYIYGKEEKRLTTGDIG